jgi:hypothetical protein
MPQTEALKYWTALATIVHVNKLDLSLMRCTLEKTVSVFLRNHFLLYWKYYNFVWTWCKIAPSTCSWSCVTSEYRYLPSRTLYHQTCNRYQSKTQFRWRSSQKALHMMQYSTTMTIYLMNWTNSFRYCALLPNIILSWLYTYCIYINSQILHDNCCLFHGGMSW